jgi:ATP-dependent protease ClpP protease subunit
MIQIRAVASGAAVYIYEEIGASMFSEGVTAKTFVAQLKALGNVRQIDVHINSPGGSVFEATAIYNALKDHRARVVVHIDGAALSAATIVAMAGDEILIAGNAMMMVHSPLSLSGGNAEQLRQDASLLDRLEASMIGIYSDRTGLAADQLRAMLRNETWLDAREAVQYGFADRVVRDLAIAARFDVSKYKNVPARFKAGGGRLPFTRAWIRQVEEYVAEGLSHGDAVRKVRAEFPVVVEKMREEATLQTRAYNDLVRSMSRNR